jgi:hypothetical protein
VPSQQRKELGKNKEILKAWKAYLSPCLLRVVTRGTQADRNKNYFHSWNVGVDPKLGGEL